MTIIVDVRLLTTDNGQIDKEDEVAVGNNFINTMWSKSKVLLNNVSVNTNEDGHYYKVCKKRHFLKYSCTLDYVFKCSSRKEQD